MARVAERRWKDGVMLSCPGAVIDITIGAITYAKDDIEPLPNLRWVKPRMRKSGDRPIQVGSHFHLFEANQALDFDRVQAYGVMPHLSAGSSVRFEPGQSRDVPPVGLGGKRYAHGFRWTAWRLVKASFTVITQTTFVKNWVVGLTLSLSLASGNLFANAFMANWDLFSPLSLAGAMALIGSAIGAAFAILVRLPTAEVRNGLHGFDQVLLMMALTSFVPLSIGKFIYACLATVICTIITVPAVKSIFGRWGLPGLAVLFNFMESFSMCCVLGPEYTVRNMGGGDRKKYMQGNRTS